MTKIPVLVIDDHAGFRQSIVHFLTATTRFSVVGEASNGIEGLSLAMQYRPEVVLLDIRMPGGNGLTFIAKLRELLPDLKIIVLTLWDTPEYRQAALVENGADAYIIKENMLKDLLPTLDKILSPGNAVLRPS